MKKSRSESKSRSRSRSNSESKNNQNQLFKQKIKKNTNSIQQDIKNEKDKQIEKSKYQKINEKFKSRQKKENPKFQISSGPIIFEGSEGAIITNKIYQLNLNQLPQKKLEQEQNQNDYQFKIPKQKQPQSETSNTRDQTQIGKDEYSAIEWENIEKEADIYWYDQDENGMMEEREDDFYFVGDQNKYKAIEQHIDQLKKKQTNAFESQRNQETDKWEINRMMNSGFFQIKNNLSNQNEEEEEQRVQIMIHDQRPPFLDGKIKYTKQLDPVSVVKDPASDMAVLAKKGSKVLRIQREQRELKKQKDKLFNLANSKMGQLLGMKKQVEVDDAIIDEDGDVDYKSSSYSAAFQKKQEGVTDFSKNKTLKEQREFLPIYTVKQELIKIIDENKVIIIVGETGSGKTTQLTQYLLERGYGKYGKIGCTQPRRVAAVSVAKRVSEELNCKLGGLVGYSIRFEDVTSTDTIIKYMTDGVLLRESLLDYDLEEYSAIIMDEAHERSLNTDVLFGLLKKIANRRRDLKIIITSATMNADRFSNFFGQAEIFKIPGRTFPVRIIWEKCAVDDYILSAVKKAIEVHLQQGTGDILIFMTGQEEIETTCQLIQEKLEKLENNVPQMLILPIYSQLRSDEQARIFEKSELRKCIVATNIAETSLTLDGVMFVIDGGYCKLKVYNPKIGMDALQVTPISQSNADQRKGRAGRTGPGFCYRLYSDANYRQDMLENNIPEIQRTNLCNVVLLLKSLKIENLLEFEFMDPPPQETILNSMYQLWLLGAIDDLGSLTDLGKKMAQFPLDPPLAKMLIASHDLECSEEILTIVSMLSVPSIFYRPKENEKDADAAREKLYIPESDHLTLLNVYEQWKKHDYSGEWASQHYVQVKTLRKVREIRSQLKDIAKQQGVVMKSCNYQYDIVRKTISSAYFTNAAKIKSIGEYNNLRSGMPCKVHPSSALFTLGYVPDYVVYHDLILTTKEYMHCVTVVDPYWLEEMGPMFFSVKQSYEDKQTNHQVGFYVIEKRIEDARKKQLELLQIKKDQEIQEKNKLLLSEGSNSNNKAFIGGKKIVSRKKILQLSKDQD